MGKASKIKGQVGETKAVQMMFSLGLDNPRKGPSQRYGVTDADVLCDSLSHYWMEVKNGYPQVANGLYPFLEQAENDSKDTSRIPLVLYKGDYKKFLVIGDAQYLLPILAGHANTYDI